MWVFGGIVIVLPFILDFIGRLMGREAQSTDPLLAIVVSIAFCIQGKNCAGRISKGEATC